MAQAKISGKTLFEELNRKLDRLGQCAPDCMTPNTPAFERWKKEIWSELFAVYAAPHYGNSQKDDEIYNARNALIIEFVDQDLPRFSPSKGSLSHYWLKIYNLTKARHSGENAAPKDDPLYFTDEEGKEYENPGILHDNWETENKDQQSGYWIEAIAKILINLQRSTRIRKNSTAPLFFPMWFAEMTTHYTRDANGFSSNSEREIFEAMRLSYLDYFMSEKCRTLLRLRDIPLRMAAEIDPNANPGERLCFRDENDEKQRQKQSDSKTNESPSEYFLKPIVPILYLRPTKEVGEDTVSKSRKYYLHFIRDELSAD